MSDINPPDVPVQPDVRDPNPAGAVIDRVVPEHSVKDTFRDSRLSALVDDAKFNVDSGLKAVAFSLVTNTAVATWATAQALEGQRHRGLGALMAVFNLVVAGIVSLTIPRVNSEVMKKIDMADESMLRSLSSTFALLQRLMQPVPVQ